MMDRSQDEIMKDAQALKMQLKNGHSDDIDEYINLMRYMSLAEVIINLKEACRNGHNKVSNINEVICTLGVHAMNTKNRKLLLNTYGCKTEEDWTRRRNAEIKKFREVNSNG